MRPTYRPLPASRIGTNLTFAFQTFAVSSASKTLCCSTLAATFKSNSSFPQRQSLMPWLFRRENLGQEATSELLWLQPQKTHVLGGGYFPESCKMSLPRSTHCGLEGTSGLYYSRWSSTTHLSLQALRGLSSFSWPPHTCAWIVCAVLLYVISIEAQSSLTVKDLMGKAFLFEGQLVYMVQFSCCGVGDSSSDVKEQAQRVLVRLHL